MPATSWRHVAGLCARFCREDSGQDLIEYGLLTGIVTVSTVLLFGAIAGKMEDAYNGWNTAAQDEWEPCPPVSSGLTCP